MGPYSCRFNDLYTPAAINSSGHQNANGEGKSDTLTCLSPALPDEYVNLSFAISVDRADISEVIVMTAQQPPNVVFMEPMAVKAHLPVTFTIIFDRNVSPGDEVIPSFLAHDRNSDNLPFSGIMPVIPQIKWIALVPLRQSLSFGCGID